jgi:hypothetical protein
MHGALLIAVYFGVRFELQQCGAFTDLNNTEPQQLRNSRRVTHVRYIAFL